MNTLAFLLAVAFSTTSALGADTLYSVADIQTEGIPATDAVAITDSGLVLTGGGIWQQNGTTQLLPSLPGGFSGGVAVNASGMVVGSTFYPGYPELVYATIWQNGQPSVLPPLGDDTSAKAYGINNAGQAVGGSSGPSGTRAVLWQNGVAQDLSAQLPETAGQSVGIAVNNLGQVVVQATDGPYLIDGNGATKITSNVANYGIYGQAMNDLGKVAGTIYTGPGQGQAFVWSGGVMQLAPPFSDTFPFEDAPTAINNNGTVVGFYISSSGERAFIWDGSNDIVDLNSLIDPNSGWVLQDAWGINDSGEIVGYGTFDGQTEGFLLTPTSPGDFTGSSAPEPATLSLLALAALPLLARRRKPSP